VIDTDQTVFFSMKSRLLTVESHLSDTQCIIDTQCIKLLKSLKNFSTIEINKIAGGSTVQCNSLSLLENFSLGRSMG